MPEKRAQRKRRSRYGFLLTFFVIVALILSFFLTSGLFFKIREIRVEGVISGNPQEVAELTGFSYGDNIFLINKMSAVRAIIAKLPYVKAVRIRKELPGTVVIIVTEAAPAAMIESKGSYWLLDAQGTLLESASILTAPKLPIVKGITLLESVPGTRIYVPFEETSKLDALLSLLEAMQTAGIWDEVGEIDLTQVSNVRFTYQGEYKIELGTPDAVEKKLQVMLLALEQVADRGAGTLYLAAAAEDKPVRFLPEGS